jgi:hypothetical protein
MPDLSSQIETLYRVIGQSEPMLGAGDSQERSEASVPKSSTSRQTGLWNRGRWICSFYCLWFSLPLSIWLSSGWIGLLLYWRALSSTACLLERLIGKPKLALAGFDSGEGEL